MCRCDWPQLPSPPRLTRSSALRSPQDLHHALTSMGTDKLSSEEADSLLKLVDKDGDGVINYDDFARLILGNGQPGHETVFGV